MTRLAGAAEVSELLSEACSSKRRAVVPGPADDAVIAARLSVSGAPITVTVTAAAAVQSLALAGDAVILDAAAGIAVTDTLGLQSGATFVTGLATSTAGGLAMDRSAYRVQVTALPPLGVLRVAGLASFLVSATSSARCWCCVTFFFSKKKSGVNVGC